MFSGMFRKKWFAIVVTLVFSLTAIVPQVFALDGIWHDPYGDDSLYSVEKTERYPRDPQAGENVYVKVTTWPLESGQAIWITWTKNGVSQSAINGEWKYNEGNNSYWEVNMGSFSKGDDIKYTVHADKDGANEKTIGPFEFTVTDWESVSSISGYTDYGDHVVLDAVPNTGSLSPKINIGFTADDVFRVQLSPTGNGTLSSGLSNYTVTDNSTHLWINTSSLKIKIEKDPYKMLVYESDGTTLIAKQYDSTLNRNMAWLTDGNSIINKVEDHFYTPSDEQFYGFGERYGSYGQRGKDIDIFVYNQYQNQGDRSYMTIPFFLNTNGYGVYLNSTYYSKFSLATQRSDMYTFTADTGGSSNSMLDYYFIGGTDLKDVVSNYTDITGKPSLLPKYAFGLWMSANEWDRQSEIDGVLSNLNTYDIPASVMVLEQWSDEHTFYIWNDAQYTAKSGDQALSYNEFTFPSDGRWPDPNGMVQNIHDAGIKVLLWQIPLLKYTDYAYEQKDNDESYMVNQGYAVGDGNGGQYRIPEGKWFGNSLLLDFTNPSAENWWMSKRAYLFDDIGIDGFKTDGGEMVWGRDTSFYSGKTGDEMRNQYPNEYIKGYYDYAKSKKSDAITFSRAGTAGLQAAPAFWAGDQASTFSALHDAMRAGLSANMSGVPFWGWDMAGFTGSYPTAELYKRSTAMAAFSPIMQFHSEKADPSTSEERSPWNAEARTGDTTIVETFRKFVNYRMNLMPYIYSEAKKTSDTGVPMMRSMVLEYPEDTNTHDLFGQYMFGENLLVAPIITEGTTNKNIYLPKGEWIDFFYGGQRPGGRTISYYADVDSIPLFVKSGSILPMNLNSQYELGGSIDNDLSTYNNLTFRVYPNGTTSYDWYDDIAGSVKTITSIEDYSQNKETVTLPAINMTSTLKVFTTKPTSVTVDGAGLTGYSSLTDLINATTGWYYDTEQKFTYVKVGPSTTTRDVVLDGVNKVEYEAEFATHYNVSTNTNHTGYEGTGFVDRFETEGDYVEFDVYTDIAGTHTLELRYSTAVADGSRALYVNGSKVQDVTLPQTTNWDTWGTTTISVTLNKGHNRIKVQYDSTNVEGVNLDNIALR
jgi:alpha-glucosidase (family GH31 glycosyl hydrolase)